MGPAPGKRLADHGLGGQPCTSSLGLILSTDHPGRVGVGGHMSHGGFGYGSRIWGLSMDNVVGLDVVLADGSVVYASGTELSDLFLVGTQLQPSLTSG